jgi:hypothetical protein
MSFSKLGVFNRRQIVGNLDQFTQESIFVSPTF